MSRSFASSRPTASSESAAGALLWAGLTISPLVLGVVAGNVLGHLLVVVLDRLTSRFN